MPKKPHKKKSYFTGKVEEAYHNKTAFEKGDRVKILPSSKQWPTVFGTIQSFTHGNFGKGRIYATVVCDDGRTRKEPLGRLRKI